MAEAKSNFAQLLKLLGIRARDLCEATGAHKTLVSRWCNGRQKMLADNRFVQAAADYLLALDERLRTPVLPEVMAAYYPTEALDTPAQKRAMLLAWLATVGWRQAGYHGNGGGVTGLIMEKMALLAQPDPVPDPAAEPQPLEPLPMHNAVVYGVKGVQGSALQFLDLVMEAGQPQDIVYVCPEGLDMYTRDQRFAVPLMNRLMEVFEAGHRLHVVLRTDYKMTDVSAFSGRWLVAHLLGYVRSHYFDDFHSTYNDKMLVVLKDRVAMKVTEGAGEGKDGIYTAICFDEPTVTAVWEECQDYIRRSKQRFHYNLFETPDGILRGLLPLADRAHYQFARLPHYCVADEPAFQAGFALADEEMERLRLDFPQLLCTPAFFDEDTPIRHIFSKDAIEDALLKARHACPELSTVMDRRVFMATSALVERLEQIKRLLETHHGYEVCFLPDAVFQKLVMQIACWGDKVAIGWVSGGKSTACRDYTNVNALTGFCETVWDRVPGMMKARRVVLHEISTWLKKAKKYGYVVTV